MAIIEKYIRVVTCQLLDRITFIRIINRIYLQSTDQISNQSLPFEPAHNRLDRLGRELYEHWKVYKEADLPAIRRTQKTTENTDVHA